MYPEQSDSARHHSSLITSTMPDQITLYSAEVRPTPRTTLAAG